MQIPQNPLSTAAVPEHMRNLDQLKDQDLLARVSAAASAEKCLAYEVLLYLREIERRRLYAGFGYASTYEFTVKHLEYSEGEAYRRISAMRLLREVPEAEAALKEGKLSLTNASAVYGFLRSEKKASKIYSRSDRIQLVRSVEGLSRKECEKALAKISPAAFPKERERVISPEETQISFVANAALMGKLERVRGLISHKMRGRAGYAELIGWMAELCLKRLDPSYREPVERPVEREDSAQREAAGEKGVLGAGATRAGGPPPGPEPRAEPEPIPSPEPESQRTASSPGKAPENLGDKADTKPLSRNIPVPVRRMVWKRAGGRCEYRDPATGERCRSYYFLEIDHIFPHALGGSNSPENLRLVCRNHNQWLAIRTFGIEKMTKMAKSKPP